MRENERAHKQWQGTVVARLAVASRGTPLITAVAAGTTVWTAIRATANLLHVFQNASLHCTVAFPEDLSHISGGVLSAERAAFVAVTGLGRAYAITPADCLQLVPSAAADLQSLFAPQEPCVPAATSAAASYSKCQSISLSSQSEVPVEPCYPESVAAPIILAPAECAALLLPAQASYLGNTAWGCLAAQAAWEWLVHNPALRSPHHVKPFLPLSDLHEVYIHERSTIESRNLGGPAGPTFAGLAAPAVACVRRWLAASSDDDGDLSEATCALCITLLAGHDGNTREQAAQADAEPRVALDATTFSALLGLHEGQQALPPACLLVGTSTGRVMAYALGQLTHASGGEETSPQKLLLFDLKQPILSVLAVAAVNGLDKTSQAVHTGLLLVGRCGRVVHVCAGPPSQRRLPQGLRRSASSAAHLSLVEWQIHSPVTSACMANGLLIYCSAGQAYCAAMHERGEAIAPQPAQHAEQHSGCANTHATLVPQLQPVQWLGSGLGGTAPCTAIAVGFVLLHRRDSIPMHTTCSDAIGVFPRFTCPTV